MSAVEQATWIGRTGSLAVKDMAVAVRVTDVRQVWNRTDVLIQPAAGSGMTWVALDSVALDELEVASSER